MADRRQLPRAPGFARLLGLLALLAGIVAMHAAVFATPATHDTTAPIHGSANAPNTSDPATAQFAVAGAANTADAHATPPYASAVTGGHGAAPIHTDFGCDMAGCGAHAGLHGCVFILVAAGFVLALVLLYRVPATGPGPRRALPGFRRAPRERAPPWTVLSLSQLSILRI